MCIRDSHEGRVVDDLGRTDEHPEQGHDPTERVAEEQQQCHAGEELEDRAAEPPPDHQAGEDHDDHRDGVEGQVGVGAVSYTHLDVYKRQEQGDSLGIVDGGVEAGQRRGEALDLRSGQHRRRTPSTRHTSA